MTGSLPSDRRIAQARKNRPNAQLVRLEYQKRKLARAEVLAFDQIEEEVGGRESLCALLATLPLTPEEDHFLGVLVDPLYAATPLAQLCLDGGVDRSKLLDKIKTAVLARSHVRSILKVADRLPDVAAGVMEDAVPGRRDCAACGGLGLIPGKPATDGPPEQIPCPSCRGMGLVPHRPDVETRTLALRLGKLLDKPSGTSISIHNQNTQAMGMIQAGTYDRLMGALDDALYGQGRERLTRLQQSDQTADLDEGETDP